MTDEYILELKDWSVAYSPDKQALKNISVCIRPNTISTIIGFPKSGKHTLLRSFNRLHELNPSTKTSGAILLHGENILKLPVEEVRRKIGMTFREPNIFPNMDIQDNVLAGYKLGQIALSGKEKNKIAEENLKEVGLWDDVKNDLHRKPDFLTKGQQQCLCIARTLALQPEIVLMDEPMSSIDFGHYDKIENLVLRLKEKLTFIAITSHLSRAARLSEYILYLENGELVEYDVTSKLFWTPADKRTEKFIAY
jgi:phosphate transport system ATP-binding protein